MGLGENMITQDQLKSIFHYDADTGVFTRKFSKNGVAPKPLAPSRYKLLKIDGVQYHAHRLAWLYMTGSIPSYFIDHINLDPSDNRFCNLREATPSQNKFNTRAMANNTTGFKNVIYRKARKWFEVKVMSKGRSYKVSNFKTAIDAAEFADLMRSELHGYFAISEHGVFGWAKV
jgi:hypothetical protein